MLKTYRYHSLQEQDIQRLLARNTDPSNEIQQSVAAIIDDVRANGDAALKNYAAKFDGVQLEHLYLETDEIAALAASIGREQQRALEIAFANIHRFHQTQQRKERTVETMPGVKCWREHRPIEKVGLYIPGGSAVLRSEEYTSEL